VPVFLCKGRKRVHWQPPQADGIFHCMNRALTLKIAGLVLGFGSILAYNWVYSVRSPGPNAATGHTIPIDDKRGNVAGYVTPLEHQIARWYIVGCLAGVFVFGRSQFKTGK
jgi:hypothetical protein